MAARPPRLRMCSAARDVSVISIQPTLYGKQQLTFLPFGKSIIYASMKPHTKQLKGSQDKAMGTFYVTIGVGHPEGGDLTEVSAMVDTGATHTMLPESLLEQLHIQPIVQRRFGIADSNERLWGVGQARIAYPDEGWTCPIIFGPEGLYLLVLQRRFREGCGVMPAWRRGAWHGSVWPVRCCPAYPPATAATLQVRTVPGAASPAPPGRPAAS